RLRWTPAIWRIASAMGSEFVSNAWRPRGTRLQDGGTVPALLRAGTTLGTDTVSNLLREFVPVRGRLGRIIVWFMSTSAVARRMRQPCKPGAIRRTTGGWTEEWSFVDPQHRQLHPFRVKGDAKRY